jgi:hypothetical protein
VDLGSFSCGGSTQMSSNTYRGPSAASEPEMQTMIAWQASRKFSKIVDLHSSGRDVRQNYAACAALPDEIDTMYTGVVSVVAEDMGYVPVRSCCSGGEISYAFSTHGTMSILFEQGRSFQPPYEDTMEELETENLPGIMNFFELPIPVRASRYLADSLSERAGRREGSCSCYCSPHAGSPEPPVLRLRCAGYV